MPEKLTREARAWYMRARLVHGPHFFAVPGETFTVAEAARQYRVWVESWVLEDLDRLVPELQRARHDR